MPRLEDSEASCLQLRCGHSYVSQQGFVVEENSWSDVDYIRSFNHFGTSDCIALEFTEKHSLDLVTVIHSWIHGPFICPHLPRSVSSSQSMIIGTFTLSTLNYLV
ncbi:vestitone reductase [Forsythia ovata]|uniref:Vestitone reductase n=1 Tax=Forsythia ovata TaxID=205694 RepID=A0ABD1VIW2_9LAMI